MRLFVSNQHFANATNGDQRLTSLIPRPANRPATLKIDDWIVYVSVHDAWFLAEWRRHKQRLKAAHPDAGGTAASFQRAQGQCRRWLREEAVFYKELGLKPPRWGG